MNNVIVLGAGMVGGAMARDLAERHNVTLCDIDRRSLETARRKQARINCRVLDVTDKNTLKSAVEGKDLVVSAVPGLLGFGTLKSIIEAGKNVVDISFFPENALELDHLAKAKEVTAIVDCGVAPGMDNLILGRYNQELRLTDFECLVGGLPREKKWPFNYKAPFSPIDVIEEYTRPARYVENGKLVVREPLTDCEYVHFDQVGTLESFNSDGLRSIIHTMPHIPNMKEKTLRYPGHVEYVRVLKESGFFNKEEIEIGGSKVSPFHFTSKVLFKEWKLGQNEEEFTVMRVTLKGEDETGKKQQIIFNLYDEFDRVSQTSSMARTTGYTATAAANMLLDRLFNETGIFPPELIGKHKGCFDYIMAYLEERGVKYEKNIKIPDNG